ADITPPVALAAYAGSAIAKSNPMKTAFNASRLAIAVFIVPYVFCFNPALLLIDTTVLGVILIAATSFIGIFGVSASLEGYLFAPMTIITRALLLIGGVCMIDPNHITDIVGLVMIAAGCVLQKIAGQKSAAV
ncbi:MAG: TRAP transporter large permease subunit, partial [Lachnospiraceae bacterium]|nr:TRAP transporter large permease subunit [Lachnospiraceae bacterium]